MDFKLKPSTKDIIQRMLPKGYSLVKGGSKELTRKENKVKKVKLNTERSSFKFDKFDESSRFTRKESESIDYGNATSKSVLISRNPSKSNTPANSSNNSEPGEIIRLNFTIPKPPQISKPELPKSEGKVEKSVSQVDQGINLSELNYENEDNFEEEKTKRAQRLLRAKKNSCLVKFPFKSAINIEKHGDSLSKGMYRMIQILKNHKAAAPFLLPIDPIKQGITDYFDIITNPMDLSEIEHRILTGRYSNLDEFMADCNLVWENAKTYNSISSLTYAMAFEMEVTLEKLVRRFESHYRKYEGLPDFYKRQRKIKSLMTKTKKLFNPKPIPERKFISRIPLDNLDLTREQKESRLALARSIKKLPLYSLRNIPDFVDFGDDNDVEIDIQRLNEEDFEILRDFIEAKVIALSLKEIEKVEDSAGSGWSSGSDSDSSAMSVLLN